MKLNSALVPFSFLILLIGVSSWWRDMNRECFIKGNLNNANNRRIKIGIIMFILSEILFFFSFFWTYFHSSLSVAPIVGEIWPPNIIEKINRLTIPLFNSLLLISSGISLTWSHNEIINKEFFLSLKSIFFTIFLGFVFISCQVFEYRIMDFSIYDSNFGRTFFLMTGFHGFHVLIGTIFLFVNFIRMTINKLRYLNNNRFELSAWYWHFVDVVWLFLYFFIYI